MNRQQQLCNIHVGVHFIVSQHGICHGSFITSESCVRQEFSVHVTPEFKFMAFFHRRVLKCSKFLADAGFLWCKAAMLMDLVK
jgi:hypothetical protein